MEKLVEFKTEQVDTFNDMIQFDEQLQEYSLYLRDFKRLNVSCENYW